MGQQHIQVNNVRVDKDVQLVKDYFDLDHLDYGEMSPVLVPRNYTKRCCARCARRSGASPRRARTGRVGRYIDGGISTAEQEECIQRSMASVSSSSDMVLLEGTGHTGVGAIIDLPNSEVAKLCGADMVLVANGGLGSSFDELELNRALCEKAGVRIRGVILNKTRPDKVRMIEDYFGRLLRERWGVPLLGVVPDLPFLGKPTLHDVEKACEAELLAGLHCRSKHYSHLNVELITTGIRRFMRKATQFDQWRRPLFVTHCTRDDVVLGYLALHQHFRVTEHEDRRAGIEPWAGAMILCTGYDGSGHEDDHQPLPNLVEMVKAYDAPVIITYKGTVATIDALGSITAKLNINDRARVAAAIEHYEPHINFDLLLSEDRGH